MSSYIILILATCQSIRAPSVRKLLSLLAGFTLLQEDRTAAKISYLSVNSSEGRRLGAY